MIPQADGRAGRQGLQAGRVQSGVHTYLNEILPNVTAENITILTIVSENVRQNVKY